MHGEEREILLALAAAEARQAEQHWLTLLGDDVGKPRRGDVRSRILGFLARHFGSVFVLALAQRAEAKSTYDADVDARPRPWPLTSGSMARWFGRWLRGAALASPAVFAPWCSGPTTGW